MRRAHLWNYLPLFLLLIAYALPWMMTPTIAGLTNGAYDLAEWTSIHPAVRADPLLLTPLLLRLPLVGIAWLAGMGRLRNVEVRTTPWVVRTGRDCDFDRSGAAAAV